MFEIRRTLVRKLFAVCCAAVVVIAASCRCEAQVPPELGAVFEIAYDDLLGRSVTGEIIVMADIATVVIEVTDEDGSTSFSNEFMRIAEAAGDPEVIQFQDFDGLRGGSVDLVGHGLLATEIVRGTVPVIEAGEVIVWNQGSGFVSAGNTGPAETKAVNVPEPIADVAFCLGMLACGLVVRKLDGNFSRLRPKGRAFQDETLTAA